MARTPVTPTAASRNGTVLPAETNGDAANDHSIVNTGRTVFLVRNADAVNPHTVEIVFQATVDGATPDPRSQAVAASESRLFGPYPTHMYGTSLQVNVDSSELKIRAFETGS